jgi:hypothetical protein
MASKNCKRMATVATLAASVVLMGGAAFASPAGHLGNTMGLVPDPVGQTAEAARSSAADVLNKIDGLHSTSAGTTGLVPDPVGQTAEAARSTAADVLNKIDGLQSTSAGTTGLVPDPVGQTAETARSTAGDVLNQVDRAF